MKELVFAPVVVALLLGTLVELEALGNQASARTIEYSEDMVAALDCAYESRPLTDCSPGIYGEDSEFTREIDELQEILSKVREAS